LDFNIHTGAMIPVCGNLRRFSKIVFNNYPSKKYAETQSALNANNQGIEPFNW